MYAKILKTSAGAKKAWLTRQKNKAAAAEDTPAPPKPLIDGHGSAVKNKHPMSSSSHKVIDKKTGKIIAEGNKAQMLSKVKALNKKHGSGSFSLGYSHGKTVGDQFHQDPPPIKSLIDGHGSSTSKKK